MGEASDLPSYNRNLLDPPGLDEDVLPPPYTERDPRAAESQSRAPYRQPTKPATTKFPPTMNAYFSWKMTSTFHLGSSVKKQLFAASTHAPVVTNRPSVILRDGPTDKHPIMATVHADKWGRIKPMRITIPHRPGSTRTLETQAVPAGTFYSTTPAYTFEVPVGRQTTTRERFEWRPSHGKEIKELSKGLSSGWNLVWLDGPVATAVGNRTGRDRGYTSDGREIVAFIAYNGSSDWDKTVRFAFMGTGLEGTMGEKWEIVVVVTAIQMWFMDQTS
ncbi:hypothetical protein N7457_002854 [Penicillium paradoxum]|uniref:uncharacterized protein n=1 Tax=Penicillium paradoxum TaxID=176176 RepID=UPI002546E359|nr:uncharacterized protein N7457_002854 [Penicillium paradoxum]KAJ5787864.1 hypothetical protein N7457_002854 [Penicillium paradoxum]